MENEVLQALTSIQDVRKIFILCAIFIFGDILTGYLKSIKNKKINSSISRDGYVKKIGWVVALIIGVAVDFIIGIKVFLIGSALVCIATEGISVYENLSEIGVKLPFNKYFAKVKDGVDNED